MLGFVLVDKQRDKTSRSVDNEMQKLFDTKKVGHNGTLDPFATGLLIIGVNKATKFFPHINSEKKTYTGVVKFGETTETLDSESEVKETNDSITTLKNIKAILSDFKGEYSQRVPDYSATKIEGEKRYDIARRGDDLPDTYKDVNIYSLDFSDTGVQNEFNFTCVVSNGTYVRQLLFDVAVRLGTISYLKELRREAIGNIKVSDAKITSEVTKDDLVSIESITLMEKLELTEDQYKLASHGNPIEVKDKYDANLISYYDGEAIALLEKTNKNIYKVKKGLK